MKTIWTAVLALVLTGTVTARADSAVIETEAEEVTATPVFIERDASGEVTRVEPVPAHEVAEFEAADEEERLMILGSWQAVESSLTGYTAGVGFILGVGECDDGSGGILITVPACAAKGVLVQMEIGEFGGSVSVGAAWAGGIGVGGDHAGFMLLPVAGIDLKVTVLRTWNQYTTDNWFYADTTYVGPQAGITLPVPLPLRLSVGVLFKVQEEAVGYRDDDVKVVVSVGTGF